MTSNDSGPGAVHDSRADNTCSSESIQQRTLPDLPLITEANECLTKLQSFSDCVLVLEDARVPCHRARLAEISDVLG